MTAFGAACLFIVAAKNKNLKTMTALFALIFIYGHLKNLLKLIELIYFYSLFQILSHPFSHLYRNLDRSVVIVIVPDLS